VADSQSNFAWKHDVGFVLSKFEGGLFWFNGKMEEAHGSISSIPLSAIRRVGFTSERASRRMLRAAFETAPPSSESFPVEAATAIREQIRTDEGHSDHQSSRSAASGSLDRDIGD